MDVERKGLFPLLRAESINIVILELFSRVIDKNIESAKCLDTFVYGAFAFRFAFEIGLDETDFALAIRFVDAVIRVTRWRA